MIAYVDLIVNFSHSHHSDQQVIRKVLWCLLLFSGCTQPHYPYNKDIL